MTCSVVLMDGTEVKTIAEEYLPHKEAILYARKMNKMMAGTAVCAAVIPYPVPQAILSGCSQAQSA